MVKIPRPFVETVLKTSPIMPNGAKLIIQRTACDTASERLDKTAFVLSVATVFRASPTTTAQSRIPM